MLMDADFFVHQKYDAGTLDVKVSTCFLKKFNDIDFYHIYHPFHLIVSDLWNL